MKLDIHPCEMYYKYFDKFKLQLNWISMRKNLEQMLLVASKIVEFSER